jgi:sugar transferase (PEP-CTERM/EpsH1 system associated)
MKKQPLLYLPHRIPFPPNKGDKIRSFNVLKHLANSFNVFVGTFIDDPNDHQYIGELKTYCSESLVVPQNPLLRRAMSASAFFTGKSLGVAYYANRQMSEWVIDTVKRHKIEKALIYSSTMAQFVEGPEFAHLQRVADFCDVDSDKWNQYAAKARYPLKKVFSLEGNRLLAYERKIASEFDFTTLVTSAEAKLFQRLAPESKDKILYVDNGVDTSFFDPNLTYPKQDIEGKVVVFTGAMDYRANVDAIQWFCDEVWQLVKAAEPDASLYIVGSNPTSQVMKLAELDSVKVTGRVADVRPYLSHARVAIAPLRIARGTQNKVLEAMSMAKQIVTSPAAADGLSEMAKTSLSICEKAEDFAQATIAALRQPVRSESARDCVLKEYSWHSHLSKFETLLSRK